jgi:hypothetical protein
MLTGVGCHLQKGEHAMLGAAIVIPGIIVLILVILVIIYFVRRA